MEKRNYISAFLVIAGITLFWYLGKIDRKLTCLHNEIGFLSSMIMTKDLGAREIESVGDQLDRIKMYCDTNYVFFGIPRH